jgi:HlyD family secretion protein
MRVSTFIVSAGIGLLLAGGPSAQESPVVTLPAITVSAVTPQLLTDRVRASGLIEPVERVLVQPQIEGLAIDEIMVEVGDWVERGQVLARLSDASLVLQRSQLDATRASAEAAIAQADAQRIEAIAIRDQAVRDRDRLASLAERGTTTRTAADEAASNAATAAARVTVAEQGLSAAEAQLNVVDAQIADLDLKLRRTGIEAPVAGEITARTAMVGAIASMAGQPLFTIVRDGLLELHAEVAERDILRLAPGQPARLRVPGSVEPLPGTVRLVEPAVDTLLRLGRVRISIEAPERVRAGMFAEAEVIVAQREALAVPASAVSGRNVLAVREGQVAQVEVATGIRDGGLVEIVEGLAHGDTVVTKAGAFVRPGDRINPVPAEVPAAVAARN